MAPQMDVASHSTWCLLKFFTHIKDVLTKKTTWKRCRSSKWRTLRKRFLKDKVCAVCGEKKKLQAHHVLPFHLWPSLELVESNLIPLCEKNNCHRGIGHLMSFQSFNVSVKEDAAYCVERINKRPSTAK